MFAGCSDCAEHSASEARLREAIRKFVAAWDKTPEITLCPAGPVLNAIAGFRAVLGEAPRSDA